MGHLLQLIFAPLLAILFYAMPSSLEPEIKKMGAIMIVVIVWWVFETLPLAITGLIGVVLSAVFKIVPLATAFQGYSHPLIFLFMGGFFMAKAMEETGLHKVISYNIISHPFAQKSGRNLTIVLVLLTAFLSMWLSNTATVAILLPIVFGIFENSDDLDSIEKQKILLMLAYAASLGGSATPVGSPPNLIGIGGLSKFANIEVSFLDWMIFSAPIWILGIVAMLVYGLRGIEFKLNKVQLTTGPRKLDLRQKLSASLLVLTIVLWLLPGAASLILGSSHTFSIWAKTSLSETVVVLLTTSLFFIFPLGKGASILNWNKVKNIDWSTLLLFGAGISLGKSMFSTGLVDLMANSIGNIVSDWPWGLIILAWVVFTIFFTEVSSNTATANLLIPLIIAFSVNFGHSPKFLALGAAIACNMAFMLPVATPPNAMVYGTGQLKISDMVKFGFILNLILSAIIGFYLFLLS